MVGNIQQGDWAGDAGTAEVQGSANRLFGNNKQIRAVFRMHFRVIRVA